jgi:hypothetical protein
MIRNTIFKQVAMTHGEKRRLLTAGLDFREPKRLRIDDGMAPSVVGDVRESEIAAQPSRYTIFANSDGTPDKLQIIQSNGMRSAYVISPRIKNLRDGNTILEDCTGEFQLFFKYQLSPIGEDLLIRYLCDETDPVDSFPVLGVKDLKDFANIDSYLGVDRHATFWEMYGFDNADQALIALDSAFSVYHKQNPAHVEQTPGVKDDIGDTQEQEMRKPQLAYFQKATELGTTYAKAIGLEEKSEADLRELRFSIESELMPFVYAALRTTLKELGYERNLIFKNARYGYVRDHVKLLYQSVKERFNDDFMLIDSTSILNSGMNDSCKTTALYGLYLAGSSYLTTEVIEREFDAILAAKMDDCAQANALGYLCESGAANMTLPLIGRARNVFLKLAENGDFETGLFYGLYALGVEHLTVDIASERAAILKQYDSTIPCTYHALDGLYAGCSAYLTTEILEREFDAILAPGMVERFGEYALYAAMSLCEHGAKHLTLALIERTRNAILNSDMDDDYLNDTALQELDKYSSAHLMTEIHEWAI